VPITLTLSDETVVDEIVRLVLTWGTTASTWPRLASASWSATVVVISLVELPVVVESWPPPELARTVMVLVPRLEMASRTSWAEPFPTASSRMTEPTPIMTPSRVRVDLSLLAVTPRSADRIISKKLTLTLQFSGANCARAR